MPQLSLVLAICLISGIGIVHGEYVRTNARVQWRPTVIIDAGHGGFDGGAVAADGTVEKEINLNISLMLQRILLINGYEVIMTRTSDSATDDVETKAIGTRKKSDLKNRLELMEDYPHAVFVSIHLNKFTTSAASGAQVFYTPNYKEAAVLGKLIQDSLIARVQPENTRVIKQGTDSTYLLKNAKIPAVIVECGFLSNSRDLQKLKNTEYQSQLSFAVAAGIMDFYLQSKG